MIVTRVLFNAYVTLPGGQRAQHMEVSSVDGVEFDDAGVHAWKGKNEELYPWSRVLQVRGMRDEALEIPKAGRK